MTPPMRGGPQAQQDYAEIMLLAYTRTRPPGRRLITSRQPSTRSLDASVGSRHSVYPVRSRRYHGNARAVTAITIIWLDRWIAWLIFLDRTPT